MREVVLRCAYKGRWIQPQKSRESCGASEYNPAQPNLKKRIYQYQMKKLYN